MTNPDLIPVPFAQGGNKNSIPTTRATSDPVYRAAWTDGFPPDTRIPKDLGGEAPDGLDFNGLFYVLSQAIVFLQKGNAYQFDASLAPYPIGALVRSNDGLTTYQNIIALNSANPNTDMTGWRVYNGSGFIVDNLTTNDSGKALSAAQGKILQDNKFDKTNLNNTLTSAAVDQALTAAQGKVLAARDFGVGQTWQDVTASRVAGTTYTNNTNRPIQVSISAPDTANQSPTISIYVDSVKIMSLNYDSGSNFGSSAFSFIVPAGSSYNVTLTNGGSILIWAELR